MSGEEEAFYTTPEGLVVDEDFDENNLLLNPVPEPSVLPWESLFRCWRCSFNSPEKDEFYAHFQAEHGSLYSIHTAQTAGQVAAPDVRKSNHDKHINSTWLATLAVGNRCVDCNMFFSDISEHVRTVHMGSPEPSEGGDIPEVEEGREVATATANLNFQTDSSDTSGVNTSCDRGGESATISKDAAEPELAVDANRPTLEESVVLDRVNSQTDCQDNVTVSVKGEEPKEMTVHVSDSSEQKEDIVQVTECSEQKDDIVLALPDGHCPECYGMPFEDMEEHMRTVHNRGPESSHVSAEDAVEEEDTFVVIEEDSVLPDSTILENRSLRLMQNSDNSQIQQYRIESAPASPQHILPDEGAVYAMTSDDVLGITDHNGGIIITVMEDGATLGSPYGPVQPRRPQRRSELPNPLQSAFMAERERNRQFVSYKTPEGKKMFSCSLCHFETKFGGTIHDHINAIHRKIKHKCTECDFETMYLKTLTYHRTKKHGVKAINCPMPNCKFKSIIEEKLKSHISAKHSVGVNLSQISQFVSETTIIK